MSDSPALDTFTRTAERAANEVLDSYSTSFGLATRLLGARHRQHVRNTYALVRVADEIVDGVAAQAGLSLAQQREALDSFRRETERALVSGYSADVVVHAFAVTSVTGRRQRNVAPPPALFSAQIEPPWSLMIERLMASPRPRPCGRNVTNGSNTRSS